jgi:3-methyladenine DNA glycosylase AlkD
MPDAASVARGIETELRRQGSPERAAGEKQYLKSDLRFLGATLADIRRAAKEASKDPRLDRNEAVRLVEELWAKPVFERRMAAALILEFHASDLRVGDLPLIERLIRESRTWALVDVLSGDVVGEMALRLHIGRTLDRWARDRDFWVRRSSLLAELKPLKNGGPFEPFARRADAMLEETEFFIRKAIGWVLRETSKRRPDEVYRWIAPRTHRASGVTMRESVKYLGGARAAQLMSAYKAGRPAVRVAGTPPARSRSASRPAAAWDDSPP